MKFKLAALTFSLCSILCAQQTIWMVGDSTMASYPEKYAPLTGWGQALNQYCKPGIKVENRALSGYSSKYFIDQGRFAAFADKIKKGDSVYIKDKTGVERKYKVTDTFETSASDADFYKPKDVNKTTVVLSTCTDDASTTNKRWIVMAELEG